MESNRSLNMSLNGLAYQFGAVGGDESIIGHISSKTTPSASLSTPPATVQCDPLSPGLPACLPYCPLQFPPSPVQPLRNALPCVSCDQKRRPSSHRRWRGVHRWLCPPPEHGDVARSANRPSTEPRSASARAALARTSGSPPELFGRTPAARSSRSSRDNFPLAAARRAPGRLVFYRPRVRPCASTRQPCLRFLSVFSRASAGRRWQSPPESSLAAVGSAYRESPA